MTEQDKFRIVGNLIELLELRRQECAKLRKELNAQMAATERLRKPRQVDEAALLDRNKEVDRLREERDKLRNELAAVNREYCLLARQNCSLSKYADSRDALAWRLQKERDYEARVAKQRGEALDLALSDLDRALSRARKLEGAIREHRDRKLSAGPAGLPQPCDRGLWGSLE